MASVNKEKRNGKETGRWLVRWYVDAQFMSSEGTKSRQRTKGGFKTKAEAEVFKAKLVTDQHQGIYVGGHTKRMLYKDWVKEWRETWPKKRPSTIARDETYLERGDHG